MSEKQTPELVVTHWEVSVDFFLTTQAQVWEWITLFLTLSSQHCLLLFVVYCQSHEGWNSPCSTKMTWSENQSESRTYLMFRKGVKVFSPELWNWEVGKFLKLVSKVHQLHDSHSFHHWFTTYLTPISPYSQCLKLVHRLIVILNMLACWR